MSSKTNEQGFIVEYYEQSASKKASSATTLRRSRQTNLNSGDAKLIFRWAKRSPARVKVRMMNSFGKVLKSAKM